MRKTSVIHSSLLAMALVIATGLISCQNSKYQPGAPVNNADELQAALGTATEGTTIRFVPNAQIVLEGPLHIPSGVTITGEESAMAKITLGKGGLELDGSLTLANIEVDASANKEPFISLNEEVKAEELNGTDYYAIENITLENCILKNVKSNLIYDNDTKYCVVSLDIENCIIELTTQRVDNEAIIAFKAGGAKDLTVRNSTIYGNSPEVMYFVRYNNSARLDRYGFDKNMDYQTMTYEYNTFFDVIKDDGQWGNYNGIGGQDFSKFIVKGNIWMNCGKDIVRRMAGGRFGQSALLEFADNTYWGADGALDESKYDTSGTILTTAPAFKNAPVDFTPTGKEQMEKHTGDPRWYN